MPPLTRLTNVCLVAIQDMQSRGSLAVAIAMLTLFFSTPVMAILASWSDMVAFRWHYDLCVVYSGSL
jgi:hypothetical protein